jgi:hypothetical protein
MVTAELVPIDQVLLHPEHCRRRPPNLRTLHPQHGDFAWQAIIHAKHLAEGLLFAQNRLDSADPFNRISLRFPKL